MGLAVTIVTGFFIWLCACLGYGAYWLTGGDVAPEAWRALATTGAVMLLPVGLSAFIIWADNN